MSDGRRIHDTVIKRKALKLFGLGHAADAIARELGVTGQTVRRWAKAAKIDKGMMAPALITTEDEFQIPMETDTSIPIVRMMEKQKTNELIDAVVERQQSPAEQYQALVAQKGIAMLQAAFNSAVAVKNVRDLKTLTEVIDNALGLTKTRGSVGGKLAIDLNILTKPQTGQIVEATIVSETS